MSNKCNYYISFSIRFVHILLGSSQVVALKRDFEAFTGKIEVNTSSSLPWLREQRSSIEACYQQAL